MSYANFTGRELPFFFNYLTELGKFRHLCWNLVGSDLRSRFRRSRLGILWAIIQPLTFALMIAAVWGSMFHVKTYGEFAVYVFSGLIVWEYFSTCGLIALDTLINAQGYIKQARIPFLIFQLRVPLTAMVILGCGVLGFFIVAAAFGQLPPLTLALAELPLYLVLLFAFGAPMAMLFSIIGAQFRDARYVVGILFQAMFFVTPVMLDRHVLDAPHLQFLAYLNPAVPLIDMFRSVVLHGEYFAAASLYTILVWIAALWVAAIAASIKVGRQLVFAIN